MTATTASPPGTISPASTWPPSRRSWSSAATCATPPTPGCSPQPGSSGAWRGRSRPPSSPSSARVTETARHQRGNLIFQGRGRGEAVVDGDVRDGGPGIEPHAGGEPREVRQLGRVAPGPAGSQPVTARGGVRADPDQAHRPPAQPSDPGPPLVSVMDLLGERAGQHDGAAVRADLASG